jgi:hypothetical protein
MRKAHDYDVAERRGAGYLEYSRSKQYRPVTVVVVSILGLASLSTMAGIILYYVQYRSLHTVQRTVPRILRLLQNFVIPVFTYLTTMLVRYTRRSPLQSTHTVDVERQQHHLGPTPEPITDIFENRSRTLEDLGERRGRLLGLPKGTGRAYKSKSIALSILKFRIIR